MAKGTLVFEFETLADLAHQMRRVLIDEVRAELDRTMTIPGSVLSVVGRPSQPQLGADAVDPAKTDKVDPTVASAISEGMRQINRETAAAAAAVDDMIAEAEAPTALEVTLENLCTASYPELLAFCEHNPAVGVDVSKCQAAFFRKLVEMKIKTYLETK